MLVKQAKHLFICMKITKYLFVCLKITWRDMSYGRACDGRTERIRNNTTGLELRTKTEEMDELCGPESPFYLTDSLLLSLSLTLFLFHSFCVLSLLFLKPICQRCVVVMATLMLSPSYLLWPYQWHEHLVKFSLQVCPQEHWCELREKNHSEERHRTLALTELMTNKRT